MRRFPASVHTDNIQQKVVGSLDLLEGLATFGLRVLFWVANLRSCNALQEQQQGEHWPEKFPWQLTVRKRDFFWGEEGGLNATTIENETLKKRRVTLWRDRVLFLVPRSLERWFQPPFVSVLTPFYSRVCFQVRGAHVTDTETHVLTHAGAQQGVSPGSPGVIGPAGHVQFCCDRSAFQCLSAALQCFQIRLQPAN